MMSRARKEHAAAAATLLRRRGTRQLFKFTLVGLSSTAVDKGTLWLLLRDILPGTPWWISASISYALGVVNGFFWNRHWTFRAREHGTARAQFVRFLSTNVAGLMLNLGATKAFLSLLSGVASSRGVPATQQVIIGSVCAIPFVTLWNFSASKYWTFRPDGDRSRRGR
jgi:putative flippase GtrA